MSILERMGMCLKTKSITSEKEKRSQGAADEKSPNVIEFVERKFNPNEMSSPGSLKRVIFKYELSSGGDSEIFYLDSDKCILSNKNLSVIERQILSALITFRKNNEGFVFEHLNLSLKSQTEKNSFEAVERSVHLKLHRRISKHCEICAKYPSETTNPGDMDYSNLGKLVYRLKNDKASFKFLAMKAILITMVNLMGQVISDAREGNQYQQEKIFHELHNQYLFMSNICPYIEQDFSSTFKDFKSTYQMNFTLCDLFAEIFWDCAFKPKDMVNIFILSYKSQSLDKEIKQSLKKIVKILWSINPLKYQISELLEFSSILGNKKHDLATVISNLKQSNSEIDPRLLEQSAKNLTKIETIKGGCQNIANMSNIPTRQYEDIKLACGMFDEFNSDGSFTGLLRNFDININNINLTEGKSINESKVKHKKGGNTSNSNTSNTSNSNCSNTNNLQNNTNISSSNSTNNPPSNANTPTLVPTNSVSASSSNTTNTTVTNSTGNSDRNSIHSANNSANSVIEEEEANLEGEVSNSQSQTFDEFYNKMFNDKEEDSKNPQNGNQNGNNNQSTNNKKAGKKGNNTKKKKKKKNKGKNGDKVNIYDPVIEEFKRELGVDNLLYAREVQKIIPNVSDDWLDSLSTSFSFSCNTE